MAHIMYAVAGENIRIGDRVRIDDRGGIYRWTPGGTRSPLATATRDIRTDEIVTLSRYSDTDLRMQTTRDVPEERR